MAALIAGAPEARTVVVAYADRRLSLHGVVAVVGGMQPAMEVARVAELFAARFCAPPSCVEATVHEPGKFLLYFADPATRRAALAVQGPVVMGGASFLLTPWDRLRRAMPALLQYKVRVCIEGVPEQARDIISLAPIFAGEALIDSVDEMVLCEQETACFCLWVWMENVERLAIGGVLKLEEPIKIESPLVHYPELGIYADIPSRSGPVSVFEHEVLIHLDKVVDHSTRSEGTPDSHRSYHGDVSGIPSETSSGSDGVVTWSYRWTLGQED
jgi:hypothetical protein